jgi:hypothetical protein
MPPLRWRHIAIVVTALVVFMLYSLISFYQSESAGYPGFKPLQGPPSGAKASSLILTDKRCAAIFPDLTRQVDVAAATGPFELKRADEARGIVQGRIEGGKVSAGYGED